MIELRHINQTYQKQALYDIDLTITSGEIVGVVGKSGSGKSTLLKIIDLMETPTSGEYLLAGEVTAAFSKKQLQQQKKKIGMVFQQFNLLSNLTVFQNVALPLKLEKRQDDAKVMELLSFVGMAEKKTAYPSQLSGGEKQRVALARALVLEPQILLCDEATSSLDEENTMEVLRLLQKIHRQLAPTIIFVSHELTTIKALCQRVIVMEDGRIQGDLPNQPQEIPENHSSYLDRVERSLRHG